MKKHRSHTRAETGAGRVAGSDAGGEDEDVAVPDDDVLMLDDDGETEYASEGRSSVDERGVPRGVPRGVNPLVKV